MTPLVAEPFFLLDESLSSSLVAQVSKTTGQTIATIEDEWPGRDRHNNPVLDGEIIPHLGNKAVHRAVWITADWKAFSQHRSLIDTHRISVMWLRGPGRNPTLHEQLQMLNAVMDRLRALILASHVPVYLRVRLDHCNSYQPFLERLLGTMLERPANWQRVPLG